MGDNVIKIKDSLTITISADSGDSSISICQLAGAIDTFNSDDFQKQVLAQIKAGMSKVVFDCHGLTYLSSTGIGSFTEFLKALHPKGGSIVFVNTQKKVTEVFELLGFIKFFKFAADIAEARSMF
jgi:anti-sigma B factor antagonist